MCGAESFNFFFKIIRKIKTFFNMQFFYCFLNFFLLFYLHIRSRAYRFKRIFYIRQVFSVELPVDLYFPEPVRACPDENQGTGLVSA